MGVIDKFSLKGKCALVTGAARGLGKAMAVALAEAGANIAVADININEAEKSACEISRTGVETISIKTDATNYDSAEECVQKVIKKFEKIDILVNNAGIVRHVNAEDMPMKDWYDVINVNLNSVFIMSQIAGRAMIRQNQGTIINISSMSGIVSNTPQNQCSYNASKAGAIMLTKSLAGEWAKYNIRVNTIAPGYMNTELTKMFIDDEKNRDIVKRWMDFTPMKRVGLPDELGGLAVYLASEASSFVTGSVFVIDGGYTVW